MTESEPYQIHYPEIPDLKGIRRIALKDSAVVELLRVESPSSFFVRPIDHIRDKLVYREPYELTPITDFAAGNFALAPLEDRTFGRCVIARNLDLLEACRVFFIDEAVTANVSWKCLFQIEESQKFYPWQVMHVTLGRLISLTNDWSFEQCSEFSNILSEFPYFQITASQIDVENQTDRPSLLVNLYGLKDHNRNLEQKVSIEEICAVSMRDVMVTIFASNLLADPKISDLDKDQDDQEIILLEEFRRKLPNDWITEIKEEWKDGDEDWEFENCRILEWSFDFLRKYLMEDGCFWGFIKQNTVVSPWEMHITPIIPDKGEDADEQWIFDQFDKMTEQQQIIDDFYSNIKNQRPLENEEIKSALTYGRVYAIASVQHRKRAGAQWLRCEILDFLPNNNLAVRFVDEGYRGFQRLKQLYRIHRIHTRMPPITMEIGRFFDDDSVSEREMECNNLAWRQIVPYDVPVHVGPRLEFLETGKLQYSQICEIGEKDNLLDRIPEMLDEMATVLEEEIPFYTDRSSDDMLRTEYDYDDLSSDD